MAKIPEYLSDTPPDPISPSWMESGGEQFQASSLEDSRIHEARGIQFGKLAIASTIAMCVVEPSIVIATGYFFGRAVIEFMQAPFMNRREQTPEM